MLLHILDGLSYCFDWVVRILTGLAISLLIPMMFLVPGDVIGRYLLKKPIPAVFEINSCFLMVIVVFFPLAYVHRKKEHVFVSLFTQRFSLRMNDLLDALSVFLGALVFGLIGWYGLEQAIHSTQILEYIPGIIDIPVWISKWFVPIGSLVFSLELLRDGFRKFRDFIQSFSG